MDILIYVKAVFALIFVLSLILLINHLLKSTKNKLFFSSSLKDKRLKIVETMHIDARHKVILFEKDSKEHLLLIDPNNSILIESSNKKATNDD